MTISATEPGTQLYSRYWQPVEPVVGSIFLCHGFGEHLGWYDGLASQLAQLGLLVFGHDHQGHGRSEGRRAYIESVEEFVSDVIRHSVEVKAEYPGLPMFLYGHSMGGMIAVATVIRNFDETQTVIFMQIFGTLSKCYNTFWLSH